MPLFQKEEDYRAFERVMAEALEEHPTRLLAYCLMPTHWHVVLWPRKDTELSDFLRWLTHTHTMRWHAHYHTAGSGHLYQGRFKAFPIQPDEHLLPVLRYVEQNALRARIVRRVDNWRWSSLWRRMHDVVQPEFALTPWPIPEPADWHRLIEEPQDETELESVRLSVARGRPYGDDDWTAEIVNRLALHHTLRSRGRPRKVEGSSLGPG